MNGCSYERPGQPPGEKETKVPPGPHMAHHGHPTNTFVEKIVERSKIGDRLYDIREKTSFESLLGGQATYIEVIGGAIFDQLVATESRDVLACRDDRL